MRVQLYHVVKREKHAMQGPCMTSIEMTTTACLLETSCMVCSSKNEIAPNWTCAPPSAYPNPLYHLLHTYELVSIFLSLLSLFDTQMHAPTRLKMGRKCCYIFSKRECFINDQKR